MKSKLIVVGIMITVMAACGTERPNPEDYRPQKGNTGSVTTTNTKKTDTKTADAGKKDSTNTMAPATPPADATPPATATPPAATPPAAPVARTTANATELANARTQYDAGCAGCHGALAMSAKKGRTAAAIAGAKAIPPHVNVQNYPVDVKEPVGKEVLNATAMAEVLK